MESSQVAYWTKSDPTAVIYHWTDRHKITKLFIIWCCTLKVTSVSLCHRRLNGSSSSVLTATSLSYEKAKNSTPHRIKTHNPIKIQFGRVDNVDKGTRHTKFYANPSKGGFPANGWNIRKNFYSCPYTFFHRLIYRSDPSADFCARWLKRRGLAQGCAFLELKNLKLIFNVFIRKNKKKLQWRLWGKLNNSLNGHNFGCV